MSATLRIGLLGHGTVGGAFDELVGGRKDVIESAIGRPAEISGVLTTSIGDFDEILAGADVIVELMGGTDTARDHVLAALHAGKPVITANKQLLAQHGAELFEAAEQAGVQLRFGAVEFTKVSGIVNGTTNFILSEMAASGAAYEDTLARAQELGYAEADPTEDVNGADAAAKMAILARLAFHTPVTLDQVEYEGIESIRADDLAYAKELGLSLKLLGVAERRPAAPPGAPGAPGTADATAPEGISVRVFPCFLYGGHPLAPISGPFNAVMVEAPEITEVTMSGPGAGGTETAAAVLGDLTSVLAGSAPVSEPREQLPVVTDVSSSFYLHLEVADRPGVLAQIATLLGDEGISVKSVVQRGLSEDARLTMVVHETPEPRFKAALQRIAELDLMR